MDLNALPVQMATVVQDPLIDQAAALLRQHGIDQASRPLDPPAPAAPI